MPFRTRGIRYWDIFDNLNLTGNLKLLLDAGDSRSYDGTSQTWTDVSPGALGVFRGETAAANIDDPTFNGVSGTLSENEYFSFDGGNFFKLNQANPVWLENFHKDNARFTIACWFYTVGGNSYFLSNTGIADPGFSFYANATNNLQLDVRGFGGGSVLSAVSSLTPLTVSNQSWHFIAVSVDEATGTGLFYLDGKAESFASTYAGPDTGSSLSPLRIGCRGDVTIGIPNNTRTGVIAAWEGRALTQAELTSIYSFPQVTFSQSAVPQTKTIMVGY